MVTNHDLPEFLPPSCLQLALSTSFMSVVTPFYHTRSQADGTVVVLTHSPPQHPTATEVGGFLDSQGCRL